MEPPWAIAVLADRFWVYGLVAVLLVVEAAWPRREQHGESLRRWGLHAMLFALASALGWLVAGGMAWLGGWLAAEPRGAWAGWWHLALVALVLDAGNYWLHRVKHRVAVLWRWHLVHHSDTMLDISTTVRHHPMDALTSGVAMGALALAIGARPAEVAAYGALALMVQIAAHANLRLVAAPWLGRVVVTPGLHHLHHAPDVRDTDSNYGEVLSLWDRLFGSFNAPRGAVTVFGVRGHAPGPPG